MTITNKRLAKKMALVGQTVETFRLYSGDGNEAKRSGLQFEKDFSRISEVELIINKKSQLHYKLSDANKSETGLEAASKQNEFTSLLKEQSAALEGVIKRELNQAGAFFSGRVLLETILFPKAAIKGKDLNHHFIIDVVNQDEVTVTEVASYKSLKLISREEMRPSLSEEEKTSLENYRSSCLENYRDSSNVQTKLEAQQDDGTQTLLFHDGQPLSLSIQYTLRCCKETGTYKLNIPSKEDIALTVPTDLAKRLVFGNKWTIGDKVSEFISKLVDAIKKLVIGKVSEHVVTEQSSQDQPKPSDESQPSSFAQRMRA